MMNALQSESLIHVDTYQKLKHLLDFLNHKIIFEPYQFLKKI